MGKNGRLMIRFFALWFLLVPLIALAAPEVMLAKNYQQQDVRGWLASEKLDGVRGYWDGKQLYSRQGNLLHPPAHFIQNFPPFAIDGELYLGRGKFADTVSAIRGQDWQGIRLQVFDVPHAQGGLLTRLRTLTEWLNAHPTDKIVIIEQTPIADINAAYQLLAEVEAKGGEGLILRHPDAPYLRTRSDTMLKLKSADDAECVVTAHFNGKGKYSDTLGALECREENGRIFRIGSGFTDADRANPPAIGSVITYQFRGRTKNGKPRFPTYFRPRSDQDL